MQDNKIQYPHIAMIVSDKYGCCREFLQRYGLNPKCFILCTKAEQTMGIKRDTPVIITYHSDSENYYRLYEAVNNRFGNIRYIDY
jgi:hypothetical protein